MITAVTIEGARAKGLFGVSLWQMQPRVLWDAMAMGSGGRVKHNLGSNGIVIIDEPVSKSLHQGQLFQLPKVNTMTSSVKVTAHCGNDKQVEVTTKNLESGELIQRVLLDDGQHADLIVYDSRQVSAREIPREIVETGAQAAE